MKTLIIIAIITISAIMILAITHYAHASCATSDVPCNDLISNPTAQTPHLAIIYVLFNTTTHNPIAITGTAYKLFSNIIVLKIQNPQGNLIEISQIQPASDGTFSLTIVPLAPLWSMQGNYTVTASSGSQEIGNTIFYYDGTSYSEPHSPHPSVKASPLKQFKSGISARDIKCIGDLQLVIKIEDGSPACVNPYTALRLAQIGWTESNGSEMQQLPDPSSALKLNLSVDPVLIHPREVVGIKISVNNTFPNSIYVGAQHKWAYENLDSPCQKIRLGVAILEGYYTTINMTEEKNLQLFNKYDCSSLNLESGKVYEFQAQSDQVKEIMCYYYFGEPCHSEGLNMNYGFDGYWDKNNTKQPFNAGTYTVIGADEWGHVAIQHFTVANSKTYTTSISQPVTVQTTDVHGTIKDMATSTPLTKLASSSTGVQLARGGCCDLYDNDSIKLELYHGKRSDSHMISAVVENIGKRTVHIYGIHVSGFIAITNSSSALNLMVLQDDPNITPKEDAILEPGESQTKYIVGNWTMMGKPVNGFSADTSYSYDDLENYNGMTNGYNMYIPIQWIQQ